MKMKYLGFFLFGLSTIVACGSTTQETAMNTEKEIKEAQTEKNSTVTGVISNAKDKTLYIEFFEGKSSTIVDSLVLNKKGKYSFSVSVSEPTFYKVRLTPNNYAFIILKPNENAVLNADAESINNTYTISGSKESQLLQEYFEYTNQFNKSQDSLKKIADALPNTDSPERRNLQQLYANNVNELSAFIQDIINNKNSSPVALLALNHLKLEKDLSSFKKVEAGLKQVIPNSAFYIGLAKNIKDYEAYIAREAAEKRKAMKIAPGNIAPEIEMAGIDGKNRKLSDLRGKYVLIDFWASWCGPCRRENPNVVKTYHQYKDKGFTVFSVSLDKTKNRWEQAIQQDQLTWPDHVSDLRGWSNAAAKEYNVSGIPYTVLIDPEGKIIATKLRGAQLETYLNKYLGD